MTNQVPVRLIAGVNSWIEGEAVAQLEATAALPGMRLAVGLPDLHAGRGYPIGAAFISTLLYPHLVGNDIGCGIGVWRTDIAERRFRPDRVAARLSLDGAWTGDTADWLTARDVATTAFDGSLGTVGAGNHFAEIQRVAEVVDAEVWTANGLGDGELMLLVHSGSRGLGESVLQDHLAEHGTTGLDQAPDYIAKHDQAVRWARANRELIAERIAAQLHCRLDRILDLTHNSATPCVHQGDDAWLHRKGAAPSDQGLVVIPGSRGTPTYLVQPVGDQTGAAWSVAHGAGRKWTRRFARERLSERVSWKSLQRTALGSVVVCGDRTLLYEEAPQAYKDVDRVVADLEEAGLVKIVGRLHPVLTYKTSAGSGARTREREHRR